MTKKRYVFVLAIVDQSAIDNANGAVNQEDISFKHVIVEAADEDEAYLLGQREISKVHTFDPERETCNDYVIEIPEKATITDGAPMGQWR